MIDVKVALEEFKKTIVERGSPSNIVWLHGGQLWLNPRDQSLYIYVANGFPYENHIIDVFDRFTHARPLSSKEPQEVALKLKDTFNAANHIEGREKPRIISSDNGAEFKSDVS